MAYTSLVPQVTSASGVTLTYTEATTTSDGFKFSNSGAQYVEIYNDHASSGSATFVASGTFEGSALTTQFDETVEVATSAYKVVGPFNPSVFNVPSSTDVNQVRLTTTGTSTGMSYAVFSGA